MYLYIAPSLSSAKGEYSSFIIGYQSVNKIIGFDKKLTTTIMIGEEAGKLDSMLVSTADAFDYEAEQATGALVALVEPVMIVIMAMVIMMVLLAVMMPMASMYNSFSV